MSSSSGAHLLSKVAAKAKA